MKTTKSTRRGNITYNFVIRWNVYAKQYRDLPAAAARSGRAKKKQEDSTDESEPIPPLIEP